MIKNILVPVDGSEHSGKALALAADIAEKYDATLGQIALAWLFSQPGITSAIAGARNGEQAKSNAEAANLKLEPEDVEKIRQIFNSINLS